ncbi:MAG: hypothetical protein IVW57_04900 [Ktedonobacterales bacterium]|nr:hypothetical protein [Ktedonobacterales bacterium]
MEPQSPTDQAASTTRPPRAAPTWRGLPLLLGAATGVLLCGAILLIVGLLTPRVPAPATTAQTLCDDLTAQRYAAAYGLLAPRQQARGSRAEFIASQRQLDALLGKVSHCAYTITSADVASVAITVTVTRAGRPPTSGVVRLIRDGTTWRVDAYDAAIVRAGERARSA